MDRRALLGLIEQALGNRRLVFVGTRGDDVEGAVDVPQLDSCISLVARYRGRTSLESLALEDVTGVRPDLDTFEIDDHLAEPEVLELRDALLRALSRPSAVFCYRPSLLVSSAAFARNDRSLSLSLFHGQQAAFEHKPWVETSIRSLGIPHIPWSYIPDGERTVIEDRLTDGPLMIRLSRSTGGVGIHRISEVGEIDAVWPDQPEGYMSVASFIDAGVPVNIGAVAWRDGVTLHSPSVQLIGIDGCTNREFGFCGNDFAAAKALDREVLESIERSTTCIGNWLRRMGYLGAFGVDFLVKGNTALFTEVNPRFQGSTHLSCRLDIAAGESCIMIEHLAAFLGIPFRGGQPLADIVNRQAPLAHLVVHNTREARAVDARSRVSDLAQSLELLRMDVAASRNFTTHTGGVIARLTTVGPITVNGYSIDTNLAVAAMSLNN